MSDIDEHPIHRATVAFITDAESIRTWSSIGGFMLLALKSMVGTKYNAFLDQCEKVEGETTAFRIPVDKLLKHSKLESEYNRGQRASQIVPRSLIVALHSQYDAFLSSLIRAFFKLKPTLVNSSQRSIEFGELLAYNSIDEAKESVIDSELEALLRESRQQQFEWLEKRFSIDTLRTFAAWGSFIELAQRRNLFVHTDGRVSKQYLNICKSVGVQTRDLNPGDQVEADSSYVRMSVDIMFEVAVKLAQVLWRKTLPEQLEEADQSLIIITYSLLERKRYSLAITLLDFAFDTVKKYSSPDARLRLLVNRANAYRLSGNNTRCIELIGSEEWSAYDPSFRMAAHILKGELADAIKCMEQIGTAGKVSKADYREWPLFECLREDEAFVGMFLKIFGEPLRVEELVTSKEPHERTSISPEFSLDLISELDFNVSTVSLIKQSN
jgi:hypothetical protein